MHQEISIILTSYNRPLFVERAIQSVMAQTCPDWRLLILDDGSNGETLEVLHQFYDERITLKTRRVASHERYASSRYALLINEALPKVTTPLVGYMCDNVEYASGMVEAVTRFFADNPAVFAGYVQHERDMWTEDGARRLGKASDFGHWDMTPPVYDAVYHNAMGMLDHSQVFHRLPVSVTWEQDISAVKNGDGVFFNRMIKAHGPIYPIRAGNILSKEHLIK